MGGWGRRGGEWVSEEKGRRMAEWGESGEEGKRVGECCREW